MYAYDDIRTVHLEITAKCQAACLQCDRNVNRTHLRLCGGAIAQGSGALG